MPNTKSIIRFIRNRVRALNYRLSTSNSPLLQKIPFVSPHAAMIELSTVCNLKCKLCPVGKGLTRRPSEFMDPDLFKKIIDDLNPWFVSTILPVMWGESMLHPQFVELMEHVQEKQNDYHIVISTNGNIDPDRVDLARLMRTGISEFLIALDAHDEESYSRYRKNGNFNTLVEFVKAVHKAKIKTGATTTLTGLVVLNRYNEKHQDDIEALFGPYLDRLQFKPMRMFMDYRDKALVRDDFHSLQPRDNGLRHTPRGLIKSPMCTSTRQNIYVNAKGHLVACCGDPRCTYDFGSLKEATPYQIRKTQRFKKMHDILLNDPYQLPQCKSCLSDD